MSYRLPVFCITIVYAERIVNFISVIYFIHYMKIFTDSSPLSNRYKWTRTSTKSTRLGKLVLKAETLRSRCWFLITTHLSCKATTKYLQRVSWMTWLWFFFKVIYFTTFFINVTLRFDSDFLLSRCYSLQISLLRFRNFKIYRTDFTLKIIQCMS